MAHLATRTPLGLALLSLVTLGLGCPADDSAEGGSGSETGATMSGDGDGDPTTTGDGDGDPTTTGDGDGDGTTTGDGDGDPPPDPEGCVSALDILIILDNSASMGPIQAALVNALPALLDPLDAAAVDWRIGVTTTDNGNPWCPAGITTPEAGKLVTGSCRSRLGDFVFNNGEIDATDIACNDICALDDLGVEPTPTEFDPNPAVRPWIESIGGQANVADPLAALSCMVPMGINGCGFESQLESAYLATIRAQDSNEAAYGFLREDAGLLVLIVSDEVDCSYNKDWSEIFSADGNKTFWADPNAAFPTSAVCWNAGVTCSGDPSDYDDCSATDFDVNGNPGATQNDAVLHALVRYNGLFDGLEAEKQVLNAGASVSVSVIAGATPGGGVTYADSPDPGFQTSFGIGPGCSGTSGANQPVEAIPPVRMREVAEQSGGSLGSVCQADLSADLGAALEPFVGTCGE